MHSESDELKRWTGLEVADAALSAVKRARECALCRNPRPPRGLYKYDQVSQWATAMHGLVGAAGVKLRNDTRCSLCEADLKAVVCIPDDILVTMKRRLSNEQRAFIETRMVVAMCETCRKVNRDETERSIRELYKHAVNRDLAPADDGLAESVLGLVAQEIVLYKLGYAP